MKKACWKICCPNFRKKSLNKIFKTKIFTHNWNPSQTDPDLGRIRRRQRCRRRRHCRRRRRCRRSRHRLLSSCFCVVKCFDTAARSLINNEALLEPLKRKLLELRYKKTIWEKKQ